MDQDRTRELLREAGRQIAAHRQIVTTRCEVCGKEITGTLKRRYCSNACRVRAFRQRHQPAPVPAATAGDADAVPALVAQLDALRAEVSRGQGFESAADIIRAVREERMPDEEPALTR
jgi:hypothetical protein